MSGEYHRFEAEPWLREAYVPHGDVDMRDISDRFLDEGFVRKREVLELERILDKAFEMDKCSFLRNPFQPVQVKLRRGVLETFPWLISALWGIVAEYAPAEYLQFAVSWHVCDLYRYSATSLMYGLSFPNTN